MMKYLIIVLMPLLMACNTHTAQMCLVAKGADKICSPLSGFPTNFTFNINVNDLLSQVGDSFKVNVGAYVTPDTVKSVLSLMGVGYGAQAAFKGLDDIRDGYIGRSLLSEKEGLLNDTDRKEMSRKLLKCGLLRVGTGVSLATAGLMSIFNR